MITPEEYEKELAAAAASECLTASVAERIITINGAIIHIKSVFNNNTSLESALTNIVVRKLSQAREIA